MDSEILKQLSELTISRDRIEFSIGDTYDIKASIVLVIATFLASLCGSILSIEGLAIPIRWLQLFVITSLVVSVVYCFRVLWLQDYRLEANPKKIQEWLEPKVISGELDVEKALRLQLAAAQNRITVNRQFNQKKSDRLEKAFIGAFVAFGFQAVSLLCLLPGL